MYWSFDIFDVVDGVRYIEDANLLLLNDSSLKVINVTDTTVSQLVEFKLSQIHSGGPVLLFKACADGQRRAVLIS